VGEVKRVLTSRIWDIGEQWHCGFADHELFSTSAKH